MKWPQFFATYNIFIQMKNSDKYFKNKGSMFHFLLTYIAQISRGHMLCQSHYHMHRTHQIPGGMGMYIVDIEIFKMRGWPNGEL